MKPVRIDSRICQFSDFPLDLSDGSQGCIYPTHSQASWTMALFTREGAGELRFAAIGALRGASRHLTRRCPQVENQPDPNITGVAPTTIQL